MKVINYILVVIPKLNFRKVIFEDQFNNKNQFYTQNIIIATLKLLGFEENKDFTCELFTKEIEND